MKRTLQIWPLLVAMAALLAGCSSDPASQPAAADNDTKEIVQGEITVGASTIDYLAQTAEGPVRIVGDNLDYDETNGILAVDFKLINETGRDLDGPVRLRFLQIMPDGVVILNADDPDFATSTGAEFFFAFADTDSAWTAGAATEPRTVRIGVGPGVSIGFTLRVLVGGDPASAMIGGRVWNDLDGDGTADEGEMGVAGARIMLYTGEKAETEAMVMYAATDADGSYGFAGLGAGVYTVGLVPDATLASTTDAVIQVVLAEYEGVVGDFLDADFGVQVVSGDPQACLAVGNRALAMGWFDAQMPGLASELFEIENAEDHEDSAEEDAGTEDDSEFWGRLTGPVTALDADSGAVAVMGTWVYPTTTEKLDGGGGIKVGDRVIAFAEILETGDGPIVIASSVRRFDGHYDRVRGLIQEVVGDEDGVVTGVIVLNTLVSVPEGFDCNAVDEHEEEDALR